jgi:hypothetical protein
MGSRCGVENAESIAKRNKRINVGNVSFLLFVDSIERLSQSAGGEHPDH